MKDFEGKYLISSSGLVYSKTYKRLLKTFISNNGYVRVQMGKSRKMTIHRLVATLYVPNPDNKPQVNHKDGNKLNNHYSNLEWVTNSENQIHSFKNGLIKSRNGRKYLIDEVPLIWADRQSGMKMTEIARKYSIGYTTVWNIIHERKYQSVPKS